MQALHSVFLPLLRVRHTPAFIILPENLMGYIIRSFRQEKNLLLPIFLQKITFTGQKKGLLIYPDTVIIPIISQFPFFTVQFHDRFFQRYHFRNRNTIPFLRILHFQFLLCRQFFRPYPFRRNDALCHSGAVNCGCIPAAGSKLYTQP